MKKLTLAFTILLTALLASCSMSNFAMTGGAEQNNVLVVTPSDASNESENESQYPERTDEWKSQPPITIDIIEGEPESCPVTMFYGTFGYDYYQEYGMGIFTDECYAIDLSNTYVTFGGIRHNVSQGIKKNGKINEDNPSLLIADSYAHNKYTMLWIRNADKPYAEEIEEFNSTVGRYIPAYDVILEITVIPNKGEEPVHYKIHAYPDGWTEDEFPIENWYAWAEETFGSEE